MSFIGSKIYNKKSFIIDLPLFIIMICLRRVKANQNNFITKDYPVRLMVKPTMTLEGF